MSQERRKEAQGITNLRSSRAVVSRTQSLQVRNLENVGPVNIDRREDSTAEREDMKNHRKINYFIRLLKIYI